MKLQKPKQTRIIGSVASLALLLALTGCGGSGGSSGEEEIAAKGPPRGNNAGGASIGVSNVCTLEKYGTPDNEDTAVLVIETTIIDKTLDKDPEKLETGNMAPVFGEATVQAQQKDGGRGGKERWGNLGDEVALNNDTNDPPNDPIVDDPDTLLVIETNTTEIDLCAAGDIGDNTNAINAVTMVKVTNSADPYYSSQCDGGIKITGTELNGLC